MAGVDCPEPPAPGGGDCAALRVGGVDGVAGGWVMAVSGASPGDPVEGIHVWSSFGELWAHAQQWGLGAVAVDIPIGLPGEDGRTCDREARARLKGNPGRTSSVFPAPPYLRHRSPGLGRSFPVGARPDRKGPYQAEFCTPAEDQGCQVRG